MYCKQSYLKEPIVNRQLISASLKFNMPLTNKKVEKLSNLVNCFVRMYYIYASLEAT